MFNCRSKNRAPTQRGSLAPLLPGLLSCALLAALVPPDCHAQDAEPRVIAGFSELSSEYISMAIQGDLRPARQLFERAVATGDAGRALRRSYEKRFTEQPSAHPATPAEGLAEGLVRAWQVYWRRNLMREASGSEAETELAAALQRVLHADGQVAPDFADPDRLSIEALRRAGLYYSLSPAPPWRDLFAWRSQKSDTYRVELTDAMVSVEVVFIEDFVLHGWKDHASLGLASTTGWVEDGRLYCVAWAYDTNSENFRVSYLKHEARHLADLERFPDMDATQLEYRAKLTELAFANASLARVWDDFRAKAADNPASAHAHANWRVTHDIARALGEAVTPHTPGVQLQGDTRAVHRAARRLLAANTAQHNIPTVR